MSLPNAGVVYVALPEEHRLAVLSPDDRPTASVATGVGGGAVVIAPAGTPEAGTVYVVNGGTSTTGGASLTAITVTGGRSTIDIGGTIQGLVIAGPDLPNAGTLYVTKTTFGGSVPTTSVLTLTPTGRQLTSTPVTGRPIPAVVAGADSAVAGQVFIPNTSTGTITVLLPKGKQRTITSVRPAVQTMASMAISPVGTPNSGTLYIVGAGRSTAALTAINPAGAVSTTSVADAAGRLLVAPAGSPRAGTVYLTAGTDGASVVVAVAPNGQSSTIAVGPPIAALAVAPGALPSAGTLYIGVEGTGTGAEGSPNNGRGTLITITPAGAMTKTPVGVDPTAIAIAPLTSHQAGEVYILNAHSNYLTTITPSSKQKNVVITTRHDGATAVTVGGA